MAAGVSIQGDLGSMPEAMKTWSAAQKLCAEAASQQGTADGEEFKEECKEKWKSSVWAFGTIREAYEKGGERRRSWTFGHCTGNLEKKHGLLEANHCASWRNWRSYIVVHLPALRQFFFWRTFFGLYRPERSTAVGGVQSVEKDMNGEHPTGFWLCSLAPTKMKRRFRAHATPQALCENLINALKLLRWRTSRKMVAVRYRISFVSLSLWAILRPDRVRF